MYMVFRLWDSGFRIQNPGVRLLGFWAFGLWALGFGLWALLGFGLYKALVHLGFGF